MSDTPRANAANTLLDAVLRDAYRDIIQPEACRLRDRSAKLRDRAATMEHIEEQARLARRWPASGWAMPEARAVPGVGVMGEYIVDRSEWPSGPWDGEPDRIEWRDGATGLPCIVLRQPRGHLCGYVAVPPGHPMHGLSDCDEATWDLEVHGGITYGSACQRGVCHVAAPGEPDDVWWLGFDANHGNDDSPGLSAWSRDRLAIVWEAPPQYRDVPYMRAQCARLAGQLAAMGAE